MSLIVLAILHTASVAAEQPKGLAGDWTIKTNDSFHGENEGYVTLTWLSRGVYEGRVAWTNGHPGQLKVKLSKGWHVELRRADDDRVADCETLYTGTTSEAFETVTGSWKNAKTTRRCRDSGQFTMRRTTKADEAEKKFAESKSKEAAPEARISPRPLPERMRFEVKAGFSPFYFQDTVTDDNRRGVDVFTTKTGGKPVQTLELQDCQPDPPRPVTTFDHCLSATDVNSDGYNDVLFETFGGAKGPDRQVYLYDPASKRFVEDE